MLSVCCFLWDDPSRERDYTFGEGHVVTLRNMVARHLHLPHEFVCVTDRTHIAEGIRCVPLDDRVHVPGTCGRKLTIWAPDAGTRIGTRILSLDLDMVIVDDITPLVDRPEDVVMFRNPNYVEGGRRAFYQGSIQLMTANSRPKVWNVRFHPHAPMIVNRRFGGHEQAWLSEMLPWTEAHWSDADGIYGAGRVGDWTDKTVVAELPPGARIVVFPGNREPGQPHVKEKFPWITEHYA
jgi:hypothetical protein